MEAVAVVAKGDLPNQAVGNVKTVFEDPLNQNGLLSTIYLTNCCTYAV